MGMDARRSGRPGMADRELGIQVEEILENQIRSLEDKIRSQLEEKALTWVEEECKKRLETLREKIREEIQVEVESWIECELKRRMDEFRMRSDSL